MNKVKLILIIELCALFIALPYAARLGLLSRNPLPIIWLGAILCLFYLKKHTAFDSPTLKITISLRRELPTVLKRFALLGILSLFSVFIFQNEKLFYFPLNKPLLWALVILLYPLLSAYPQELIFRKFFCHRYKQLFNTEEFEAIANGFFFATAHLIFGNWVTLSLSFVGGYIFCRTYQKSNSLLLCTVEHSLYGLLIFTIGLGHYFYHGAMHP
ncbi:MAG: CPBP family intramembrane metalloprotease [Deltaproteobacteria bacterium]|nr:CPBP family intramembrane metalloprotease [Deltaproteobacteria bacterium]